MNADCCYQQNFMIRFDEQKVLRDKIEGRGGPLDRYLKCLLHES